MPLLLFCQGLLKIPTAFFILTSLEFNPTPNFSLSWRKENKMKLFLAAWPTPWALGCSWTSLWLWREFRDLTIEVSKAGNAFKKHMAGRNCHVFPCLKARRKEETGLIGVITNGAQKFKVCFCLSQYLPHCQKMHTIPSLLRFTAPTIPHIKEETFQETGNLLFCVCESDSSVLCLFKY